MIWNTRTSRSLDSYFCLLPWPVFVDGDADGVLADVSVVWLGYNDTEMLVLVGWEEAEADAKEQPLNSLISNFGSLQDSVRCKTSVHGTLQRDMFLSRSA